MTFSESVGFRQQLIDDAANRLEGEGEAQYLILKNIKVDDFQITDYIEL
jgi:hypothetical protein